MKQSHIDVPISNAIGTARHAEGLPLTTIYITDTLLESTGQLLASFARDRESEGIVYWFGFEFGRQSIVTTLVVPDAETSLGCISTSPEVNAQALSLVVGTPLILIGQAHSHPSHRVRHSWVDDHQTFARFDGAISIVVPYFARRGVNLYRCGVHRHIDGSFKVIKRADLNHHLVVIPGKADFRCAIKPMVAQVMGDCNGKS